MSDCCNALTQCKVKYIPCNLVVVVVAVVVDVDTYVVVVIVVFVVDVYVVDDVVRADDQQTFLSFCNRCRKKV